MAINFGTSNYCSDGGRSVSKKIFLLLLVLSINSHQNVIFVHGAAGGDDHETVSISSAGFWGQIMAIFALVVCSGIVAGIYN